jgi:hypothetical protein
MTNLACAYVDGALVVGPADLVGGLARTGLPGRAGPPPVTLAVSGGLLLWPWVHDEIDTLDAAATLIRPPIAVLDDVDAAQDWLWALYGREAALAVAAGGSSLDAAGAGLAAAGTGAGGSDAATIVAGQEWLPATAARFAFGAWLAQWWPASTLDDIPALDPTSLRTELDRLTWRLGVFAAESDGPSVALPATLLLDGPGGAAPGGAPGGVAPGSDDQARYALAAGPGDDDGPPPPGTSVHTGVGGTSWSDIPPGWVDASDLAVTWRLLEDIDRWHLAVRAAAGARLPGPQARLTAEAWAAEAEPTEGRSANARTADTAVALRALSLRLGRDPFGPCWVGELAGATQSPLPPTSVRVYLPGFAPASPSVEEWQNVVRSLARTRLATVRDSPRPESVAAPFQAELDTAPQRPGARPGGLPSTAQSSSPQASSEQPSSVPPSPAQSSPVRTITIGATGEPVAHLQQLLRARGQDLEVDGRYGTATTSAVTTFQRVAGLVPDGITGPRTWAKLLNV